MGVTYVYGTVRGAGKSNERLKFLVDSGTQYTLLPEVTWKKLRLKPKRQATFTLADGTQVEWDISEGQLTLDHGDGHTPVILGQPGDKPLLGVVTLEELGLMLNPFNRTLQPMRLMM